MRRRSACSWGPLGKARRVEASLGPAGPGRQGGVRVCDGGVRTRAATSARRLPGVDEAVAARRLRGDGGGGERRGDERPRLRRVDDVVDLEQLRGVERPGVLLRGGGDVAHALLTLAL